MRIPPWKRSLRTAGLTIRPIYHYFGNKKALFAAVNEVMEQRIIESMKVGAEAGQGAGIVENWRAYLDLCDDPGLSAYRIGN